jgi:hypothetical protein
MVREEACLKRNSEAKSLCIPCHQQGEEKGKGKKGRMEREERAKGIKKNSPCGGHRGEDRME